VIPAFPQENPDSSGSRPAGTNRRLATAGRRKPQGTALHDQGATDNPTALRRRKKVEMLRSLPMRAHLAVVALRDREDGQALVEYALLLSLIAVASIAILTTLGQSVSGIFSTINHEV
jgi:pilus assembly protein Flp/PilA